MDISNIVRKLWESADTSSFQYRFDINECLKHITQEEALVCVDQYAREILGFEYHRIAIEIRSNKHIEDALSRASVITSNGIRFHKEVEKLKVLIANYDEWKNEF